MNSKKKYIIFSPINQYGGVNLDVGFIAHILSKNNDVKVISLGNYFKNSSIFYFSKHLNYNSLDRITYYKNILIKIITSIVSIVKPIKIPNHFRIDNSLTKSLINIHKKRVEEIKIEILKADEVILCSQLTSKLMKEIIELASIHNKKIFFRLTGQIVSSQLLPVNIVWLKMVSTFIHHSKKNRDILNNYIESSNHVIIDQNAYNENRFLNIPFKSAKIRRFFTLSRLHKLKQIDIVIKAFINVSDNNDYLTIYGSGDEEKKLKKIATNNSNIIFKDKIAFSKIQRAFSENDCLIISSSMEAGPYTGVESMASGIPIITTNVGAMKERLPDYNFFYDGSINGLELKILEMKQLSEIQVTKLSQELRLRYLEKYSEKKITTLYESLFSS